MGSAYLETTDGCILSSMHESIRDFIREGSITFTPTGVQLHGRDSAKIVIVRYNIDADLVRKDGKGKYECTVPLIRIGINAKLVAVCLRSVSNGDLVRFVVDQEKMPDKLTIMCQNKSTGKKSCFNIVTPDVEEDPMANSVFESFGFGYNSPIEMTSALFHDMMRDLAKTFMCEYRPDDKAMRVCCDGNRMVLIANGKLINSAFEVMRGDASASTGANVSAATSSTTKDALAQQQQPAGYFKYTPDVNTDRWPVCERFSLPLFQKVAKAKGVSNCIQIRLQPSFPIIITYKTSIGTLSYIITIKDDPEWISNPSSRKMPGVLEDIIIPGSTNAASAAAATANTDLKDEKLATDIIDSSRDDLLSDAEDELGDGDVIDAPYRKRLRSDDDEGFD